MKNPTRRKNPPHLQSVPTPPAANSTEPAPVPPPPVPALVFVLTNEQAGQLFEATYDAQSCAVQNGQREKLGQYDQLRALLLAQHSNQAGLLKDVTGQYALQMQMATPPAPPAPESTPPSEAAA